MKEIKVLSYTVFTILYIQLLFPSDTIVITNMHGEVKVRHGIEETWEPAMIGMKLKEIDTILILEGEVTLRINNKMDFKLVSHSILDIGDLRHISKRELFLFLMSQKIEKMDARKESTKLRIGNVSVVHGESKSRSKQIKGEFDRFRFDQEMNGAKALYSYNFFTNTIVSLYKTLNKYNNHTCPGELYFLLGKSFEMLDEPGQAVDNFQKAIECAKEKERTNNISWLEEAREAVNSLKDKE